MKRNNKGIGAVVVLLSILVVTAVGFTGYYVWNSQNNDSVSSNDVVSENTDTTNEDSTKSDQPINNENTENTAIVIKELGVQIPYGDAANIVYVFDDQARESMVGSTEASVSFFIKDGLLSDGTCNDLGITLYVLNTQPTEWKYSKVGDKYYVVTGSPSSCGTTDDEKIRNSAIGVINVSNIEAQ
jgi:hypothetical protein